MLHPVGDVGSIFESGAPLAIGLWDYVLRSPPPPSTAVLSQRWRQQPLRIRLCHFVMSPRCTAWARRSCRDSRAIAEDRRLVSACSGGCCTATRSKGHYGRLSTKGFRQKKDPIKEVSRLPDLPELQAGAEPALPPAAVPGSGLILCRSETYRWAISLMPLGSRCRTPPGVRGSDPIAGLDRHLLSNDRVRFARNCD
jgi:hypothetical protein